MIEQLARGTIDCKLAAAIGGKTRRGKTIWDTIRFFPVQIAKSIKDFHMQLCGKSKLFPFSFILIKNSKDDASQETV